MVDEIDTGAPGPWQAQPGMVARWRPVWESLQVCRLRDETVALTFIRGDETIVRLDLPPDAARHLAAMLDGRAPTLGQNLARRPPMPDTAAIPDAERYIDEHAPAAVEAAGWAILGVVRA